MTKAKPFLKWPGGKTQLLADLDRRRPTEFKRYHEIFLGGGAFYFHLYNTGQIKQGAVLCDINPELINTYRVVRDQVEQLIEALQAHHANRLDPDYYYAVRGWDREPGYSERPAVERAARTIYLNRTCFNGLYRLNRRGQFNAPIGSYKNPQVLDPPTLRAASLALRDVELRCEGFEQSIPRAERGDFVYLDPPYVPASETASFTSYAGQTFGPAEQEQLAQLFNGLHERGVHGLLSNSEAAHGLNLYQGSIEIVQARRNINSAADKRGNVGEILVSV